VAAVQAAPATPSGKKEETVVAVQSPQALAVAPPAASESAPQQMDS